MNNFTLFIYIFTMAVVTYLIRMIPFVLLKKKIKSTFAKSFLYYTPCAVLSAMTIPAVFYSTADIMSAVFGFVVSVLVALRTKSLIITASCASLTALLVSFVMGLF